MRMMSGIVAETGCAGDAKAAAARPKGGGDYRWLPCLPRERMSTEFRKWGKRGTARNGRVRTYRATP